MTRCRRTRVKEGHPYLHRAFDRDLQSAPTAAGKSPPRPLLRRHGQFSVSLARARVLFVPRERIQRFVSPRSRREAETCHHRR